MGQVHRLPECVTLDDWRQLTNGLARNLTDQPVGTWTAAKRDEGARASDLHTDHGEIPLKVDPTLERVGPRGGIDTKRAARSRARRARIDAYNALRAALDADGTTDTPETGNGTGDDAA